MTPRVIGTAAELRALARAGDRAVVMTMGALHEGHAALVRAARDRVGPLGQVVVTVFVNPLQFGAGEDLERYPRTLEADLEVAGKEGADVVFAPSAAEVYPGGEPQVRISAGPMGDVLEGAFRPGHFDGMLTVVAKLLHLTAPDAAFFGQKDAQQLALVRRMVRDLNFPVEIVAVPTVREHDGLALSSRNRFLNDAERASGLALSRALRAGAQAAPQGPAAALRAARQVLEPAAEQGLDVDYVALIDPEGFAEITDEARQGDAVLAVAARVGTTRLIDNAPLHFGQSNPGRSNPGRSNLGRSNLGEAR
ncbi:pantoate--beta-alanine ligase [Streptomyces sp. AA1529]|uniref:pantoate--beta-alanine ligase n=1 Tax=Streptomyces sp. AA1529 TaxID=1203257 RepID=UPI0002E46D38|nr:pantoate--beta-alanine ligase [Streptomyces sp. AA1529]